MALFIVLGWLAAGRHYNYSDTWLVSISVITGIIIFVMVFCIQNTQNRDSKSISLKLNELIVTNKSARDAFVGLEMLTDNELDVLDGEFKQLLEKLELHPTMHKLHKKIIEERARRPGFSEQAEHLIGAILNPFNNKHDDKS